MNYPPVNNASLKLCFFTLRGVKPGLAVVNNSRNVIFENFKVGAYFFT